MFGFLTRKPTDEVIRAFVNSQKGTIFKNRHHSLYTPPYTKTDWIDFNLQQWMYEYKNPIVVFGILRGTEELLWYCKEYKIDFYYIDHAYFFKTKHKNHMFFGDRIYRITKNLENLNYLTNEKFIHSDKERARNNKRIGSLNILSHEQRISKGHEILLCPPSEFVCRYYKLSSPEEWTKNKIEEIKKYTDRPIIVRNKKNETPLETDLSKTHCIVTYQSTVAIEAIIKGIPSICDEVSPCLPVSETNISKIEKPFVPDEELLHNWIHSLLNNQFSMKEIRNGKAFEMITRLQK
jgi:hypothetical protein